MWCLFCYFFSPVFRPTFNSFLACLYLLSKSVRLSFCVIILTCSIAIHHYQNKTKQNQIGCYRYRKITYPIISIWHNWHLSWNGSGTWRWVRMRSPSRKLCNGTIVVNAVLLIKHHSNRNSKHHQHHHQHRILFTDAHFVVS